MGARRCGKNPLLVVLVRLKHTAFRVKSPPPSVDFLSPLVGSGEEYEAPREHPPGPRRANRGVATPVASRPSMYGEATVSSRSASVMCVVATHHTSRWEDTSRVG